MLQLDVSLQQNFGETAGKQTPNLGTTAGANGPSSLPYNLIHKVSPIAFLCP